MKKNTIVFLCIVMICFLFVACSDDNRTGPNDEIESILPLAVGNEWQYVDSESDSVSLILEVIASKEVIYNNDNLIIYNLPGIAGDNVWFFYSNSELMVTNETMDTVFHFLKHPVDTGDEWYNPFEGGKIKCLSKNQSIHTPAGNFDCIVYGLYPENNDDTPYLKVYCYPNIGFVAIHSDINCEEDKWELLNTYTINQ